MEGKEGVAGGGTVLLVLKNPNEASEHCLDIVVKLKMICQSTVIGVPPCITHTNTAQERAAHASCIPNVSIPHSWRAVRV